jgi:hypothetical protein
LKLIFLIFSEVVEIDPSNKTEDIESEAGLSPIPGPPSPPEWIRPTPTPEPDPDSSRDMFSDEEESLGSYHVSIS